MRNLMTVFKIMLSIFEQRKGIILLRGPHFFCCRLISPPPSPTSYTASPLPLSPLCLMKGGKWTQGDDRKKCGSLSIIYCIFGQAYPFENFQR